MNEAENREIQRAIHSILQAIGEEAIREGLLDTPKRVAKAYEEIFSGIGVDEKSVLGTTFDEEDHHELVIVKDIEFFSMCEHHLLPFFGKAHIGYIPNGSIVGISKLARLVEIVSKRPQVQERMVSEIAEAINDTLNPLGVMVVIEAQHLCMMMRGIKKPGSSTVTSAVRGVFMEKPSARAEFLSLIK